MIRRRAAALLPAVGLVFEVDGTGTPGWAVRFCDTTFEGTSAPSWG